MDNPKISFIPPSIDNNYWTIEYCGFTVEGNRLFDALTNLINLMGRLSDYQEQINGVKNLLENLLFRYVDQQLGNNHATL